MNEQTPEGQNDGWSALLGGSFPQAYPSPMYGDQAAAMCRCCFEGMRSQAANVAAYARYMSGIANSPPLVERWRRDRATEVCGLVWDDLQ